MNKSLQQKILRMVKQDQKMRMSGKWNSKVDIKNTQEMKKIVSKYGWPDINLVGKKGSEGAWILVQHADLDVKFQEKCLKLIKEKLKDKKVLSANYAYLKDRVNVNRKRPQVFGTQFYLNKNNKLVPRPIRDRKNLDKRRKKYGLESFSKYKKMMEDKIIKKYGV